jgi:A/G-specific adenine glycosylase
VARPIHLKSTANQQAFRNAVTKWYLANARDLPWRRNRNPYAIWVSEIMLQQTQVATVIDYYHRFLARFPNACALAAADEQEVLKLWSGLGYYRRARQMHAAAKVIASTGGEFPSDLESILGLPGIGRYTAGAILSFAFDRPAPIVEANTLRLYSRLIGLESDPRGKSGQAQLWSFAEAVLPTERDTGSGVLNQGLMEIGSQVCTPTTPKCGQCPIQRFCCAFANQTQSAIPMIAAKKRITELQHAAIIIGRRGKFLLRQNTQGEWWQGLWDFPRIDLIASGIKWLSNGEGNATCNASRRNWLVSETDNVHGVKVAIQGCVGSIQHAITRYRIHLFCFQAELDKPVNPTTTASKAVFRWFHPNSTELPLTSPAKKVLKLIGT